MRARTVQVEIRPKNRMSGNATTRPIDLKSAWMLWNLENDARPFIFRRAFLAFGLLAFVVINLRNGRCWRSAVSSILFAARSTHFCVEARMRFAHLCRCHCFHRTENGPYRDSILRAAIVFGGLTRNHRSHQYRDREWRPLCGSRSGCSDWFHAHHLHNMGDSWISNRPIPEVSSCRLTRRGLQRRYLYADRCGSRIHCSIFACFA